MILTGLADAKGRIGVVAPHVVTAIVKITDWDEDRISFHIFQSQRPPDDNRFATATHAEVAFMAWFYSEYVPLDSEKSYGGYCDVFLRFTPCTINDGAHKSADQWGIKGADAPPGCHEKLVEMAKAYPNWTFRVFAHAQYDPTGVQRQINGKGPYNPMLFHDSDSTAPNLEMGIRTVDQCKSMLARA